MIWQYLFWALAVVTCSLAYITWGSLRMQRKLERELADIREETLEGFRDSARRRLSPASTMEEIEAAAREHWNELHTWPKNWSV